MIFSSLLTAFIVMPILELWLLVKLGGHYGIIPTLLLVVATGIAGAWMARTQGVMVLLSIQREMAQGRMPAPQMIDGVMILVAGVLLLTPGLITDAAGFLLLVPPVRVMIRGWLRRKLERKLHEGNLTFSFRRW
jgi:UPF0716 protein FxsA